MTQVRKHKASLISLGLAVAVVVLGGAIVPDVGPVPYPPGYVAGLVVGTLLLALAFRVAFGVWWWLFRKLDVKR